MSNTISATTLQMYEVCRRQWYFANVLDLEPKKGGTSLWLGSGVHEALEAFYRAGQDPVVAFEAWWNRSVEQWRAEHDGAEIDSQWYNLRDLGMSMMSHYRAWARQMDDFEVLATELPFRVEIPNTNGGALTGRFDGVIRLWRRPTDIYLLENKTYKRLPPHDFLLLDTQTAIYQWAATKLLSEGKLLPKLNLPEGTQVKGVLYNGLRKSVPKRPPMDVTGQGVSKDLRYATTYAFYLNVLEEENLPVEDYQEILAKLKLKLNQFFHREWVQRTPEELVAVEERLVRQFTDVQATRDTAYLLPSPSWDCAWRCAYYTLCLAYNQGGDTVGVQKRAYQKRVWTNNPTTEDWFW